MSVKTKMDWDSSYPRMAGKFRASGMEFLLEGREQIDARRRFYLELLERHAVLHGEFQVADLGCGLSWFGALLSSSGLPVTMVDDFGGGGGVEVSNPVPVSEIIDVFRNDFGIGIVEQDLLRDPLPLGNDSVDAVTCFHSLEHWHHSPVRLFAEIRRVLKPGGILIVATPNSVNLRKRIAVPFGATNLCELDEWWESYPVFRGHVREPTLAELRSIVRRGGLDVVASYGRNFIGADNRHLRQLLGEAGHKLVRLADTVLRAFPTLCSDIHVVGRKP